MAIKVMLADDDIEMLETLQNIINWTSYGFELIAVADNGVELLDKTRSIVVDLLITDITMPVMDGFELVLELKERNPALKVILLTCHEDFEYAKKAIDMRVDGYLVKYSLTKEKLLDVLSQIRAEYQKESEKKDNFHRYSHEIYQNKGRFKEKLIDDVISYKIENNHALDEKLKLYDIVIPIGRLLVIGLYVDDFDHAVQKSVVADTNTISFAIINIAEEVLESVVFPYQKRFITVVDEKYNKSGRLLSMIKKLQKNVLDILNIELSVSIGDTYLNFLEMGRAVAEVEQQRDSYFYMGSGQIVTNLAEFQQISAQKLHEQYYERLKVMLKNPRDFTNDFVELCNEIEGRQYQPSSVKQMMLHFIVYIESMKHNQNIQVYHEKHFYDTFAICKKVVLQEFYLYQEDCEKPISKALNSDVKAVIEYVQNNLSEEITLELVAAHIYKNSSYLSRLFKKSTGKNFSEYLIAKRIEKATYLLRETNLSVLDICKQIGIDNLHYFYRFYKRETGKKPGEVRNANLL